MKEFNFLKLFENETSFDILIQNILNSENKSSIFLKNIHGSLKTIIAAHVFKKLNFNHVFIIDMIKI